MKSEMLGIICMIIYEVLLGVTPLLYKYIDVSISSSLIVAYRYLFAALLLTLWAIINAQWKQYKTLWSMKRIAGVVFLGMFGSGIAGWWNAVGVRNIGVIMGTLLVNLEIPLGVALGYVLLKEPVSAKYLKILALILIGYLLLVVKNDIPLPSGGSYIAGMSAAAGAAVIWGMSTIIGKKLIHHTTTSVLSFWRMLLGGLTAGFISLGTGADMRFQLFHASDWVLILLLGAISAVGLLLYYCALHRLTVRHISLFFPLSAVISVVLGFLTGESPLASQWVGIVLILGGIIYFFMKKKHYEVSH